MANVIFVIKNIIIVDAMIKLSKITGRMDYRPNLGTKF